MAWVRTVDPSEAAGYVKTLYESVQTARGFLPNIVRSTTSRPDLTRAWMSLYTTVMFGASELSRVQREMLATVVSVANRCHY